MCGGVKVLRAVWVSCTPSAGGCHAGSPVQERSRRDTGSEQLYYLGSKGAIYFPGLTCFCRPGELCSMEKRYS